MKIYWNNRAGMGDISGNLAGRTRGEGGRNEGVPGGFCIRPGKACLYSGIICSAKNAVYGFCEDIAPSIDNVSIIGNAPKLMSGCMKIHLCLLQAHSHLYGFCY
mgnify:CR=1 FL=1